MIKMSELIKKQNEEIRKQTGMVKEVNVSSKPFEAWREHEIAVQKLYRDCMWAQKAFPNKKKEIKEMQKLLKKLDPLVRVITGQAVDL